LRYVHERLLKPGLGSFCAGDVRVTDPLAERPRAAGFVIYQQLNHGPIERAVQAGQVTADEVAAYGER
jgi:hypothetical protein